MIPIHSGEPCRQLALFGAARQDASLTIEWGSSRAEVFRGVTPISVTSCFTHFFDRNLSTTERITSSKGVIIKVNLTGVARPEEGKTTSPIVLNSLIVALADVGVGPANIVVADSSVIGTRTLKAARETGILQVCEDHHVKFRDIRKSGFSVLDVEDPILHRTLPVYTSWMETDVFRINLAKIKTTYGSPVGLCTKNLKGLLDDDTKLSFHLTGLQRSLVDLGSTVFSDLNILEGLPASELGQPKECGLLALSDCSILLDSLISTLVGIPVDDIEHLSLLLARKDQKGPILNSQEIDDFRAFVPKLRFVQHGISTLSAEFGIELVDGKPCSGCLESFYKALKRLYRESILPDDTAWILGAEPPDEDLMRLHCKTMIEVGNCAIDAISGIRDRADVGPVDLSQISTCATLKGCPPTIDSMVQSISAVIDGRGAESEDLDGDFPRGFGHTAQKRSRIVEANLEVLPLIAQSVSAHTGRIVREVPDEPVIFTDLGQTEAVQCELVTASICHQINWDFLRERIRLGTLRDPGAWSMDKLRKIRASDVENLLSDYSQPSRIHADERARMLRSIGDTFANRGPLFLDSVLCKCDTISEPNGLMAVLLETSVFSEDPEHKKAQVLIHTLLRSGLWNCSDPKTVAPAIDYHILRLYMRLGVLWPRTKAGQQYIASSLTRRAVTTNALRYLAAQGMTLISDLSKIPIVDVNAVEWWIGRSVCTKDIPDCNLSAPPSAWLRDSFDVCPYYDVCYARTVDPRLLRTTEPKERSRYY